MDRWTCELVCMEIMPYIVREGEGIKSLQKEQINLQTIK